MKRVLRFVAALLAVIALHALGVRLFDDFAVYVDLFLVLTAAWAFGGNPLTGLTVGLVAGLAADAFSGGLYGLHGFANTLVGYMTAVAVLNLAKLNTSGAASVFALAAVAQQLIVVLLALLMLPNPEPPTPVAVLWKVAITAAMGAGIFLSERHLARLSGKVRRARESRLRF